MKGNGNVTRRLPTRIEALIPIVVLLAIMISNYVLDWGSILTFLYFLRV